MWLTHPRMFTYDRYGHAKALIQNKKLHGPSCRKDWRARVDSSHVPKYCFNSAQPASQEPNKRTSRVTAELGSWSLADVSGNLQKLLAEQRVCVHPAPHVKITNDTYQLWYHCHRGGSQSTTAICEHRSLGCVARRRAPHPKRVGCGWRLKLVYPANQPPTTNPLTGMPLPSSASVPTPPGQTQQAGTQPAHEGEDEEAAASSRPAATPHTPQHSVRVFLDGCHSGHVLGSDSDKAFFPVQEVRFCRRCTSVMLLCCTLCAWLITMSSAMYFTAMLHLD